MFYDTRNTKRIVKSNNSNLRPVQILPFKGRIIYNKTLLNREEIQRFDPTAGRLALKAVAPPLSESLPAVLAWAPSVACWTPSITFRLFILFFFISCFSFSFYFPKIILALFTGLRGIYTVIVSILPPGMLEWKYTSLNVDINTRKCVYFKYIYGSGENNTYKEGRPCYIHLLCVRLQSGALTRMKVIYIVQFTYSNKIFAKIKYKKSAFCNNIIKLKHKIV